MSAALAELVTCMRTSADPLSRGESNSQAAMRTGVIRASAERRDCVLGSMHDDQPCALARVEALCVALSEQQVHIAVVSELATEDDFGEVTLLTSDPDIDLVDVSNEGRATMKSQ